MLKENWRFINRVHKLADLAIIFVAFYLAYFLRAPIYSLSKKLELDIPIRYELLAPIHEYYFILLIATITTVIFLNVQNVYSSMRLKSLSELFSIFCASSLIVFVVIAAFLYFFKEEYSRSFIALFCLFMAILLCLERLIVIKSLRYFRRKGFNFRNVIICGIGPQSLSLLEEIYSRPEMGIRVRLISSFNESDEEITKFKTILSKFENKKKVRISSGLDNILSAIREYAVDEVIFTNVTKNFKEIEKVVECCIEQGIGTTLAADLFSMGLVKSGMSYFGSIPLIHYKTPPGDSWELGIKRLFDIAISALLLVSLSPLLIIVSIIIKLTSVGPVFFLQRRVGMNGHLFTMYKFRSMSENPQSIDELEELNEMKGPAFKIKNDPRITSFGKFIRKHSIDELPQLLNVLKGDMSLVGPRPPVPSEVSQYLRHYRRRLSMRPGLTCIWQVSGRNEIQDFAKWVELDLEYIDNWSLLKDFVLLFKTIPAIIFGNGAR